MLQPMDAFGHLGEEGVHLVLHRAVVVLLRNFGDIVEARLAVGLHLLQVVENRVKVQLKHREFHIFNRHEKLGHQHQAVHLREEGG